MSTPAQWRNKSAQQLAVTMNVTNDQHVCQPCRQDISKLLTTPSYIPRWSKTVDLKKCCVFRCVNKPPLITSKTLDANTVKIVLEANKLKVIDPFPQSICLCKEHYNVVYKSAFPTQTKLVDEHLKTSTGFEGNIRDNDRVCYTCYRSHLVIIQKIRSVSNDSDLEELIDELQPPATISSLEEAIDAAIIDKGRERDWKRK